jgi:hypothetical protein
MAARLPQCLQIGAIRWIAHSKLSKTRRLPAATTSNALSYSLPHTSHHSSTWLLLGGWLVLARALDTLLAPAAGLGLRQGGKPFRLDRLVAELAGAVGTAVHTFERCGEAIDAARESLPFPRD